MNLADLYLAAKTMKDQRRVLSENTGLPAPLRSDPNSFAKRSRAKAHELR